MVRAEAVNKWLEPARLAVKHNEDGGLYYAAMRVQLIDEFPILWMLYLHSNPAWDVVGEKGYYYTHYELKP